MKTQGYIISLIIILALVISLAKAQVFTWTSNDGYAFREEVVKTGIGSPVNYWYHECRGKCTNLTEEDRLFGSWDFSPSYDSINFSGSSRYYRNYANSTKQTVLSEVFVERGDDIHFHSKTFDQ